ncbi:MAG: hypothetical protein CFE24_06920 [Flavobacterium sp. BFFFF2]|nr:MAG: hypothetical protein CFE24_06920 [Flavobacterium sp. BFFFF2]
MYKKVWFVGIMLVQGFISQAQIKVLFDATKAETAGCADWVIDSDTYNLGWAPNGYVNANNWRSNAQRVPSPPQSQITSTTTEDFWTGGISAWGVDCAKKGYTVETLPYNGSITYNNTANPQDLSNYDVYIVVEPNILFTTAQKTAIMQFVQNGGGLFMISDHTISDRNFDNYDSPVIWNDLMSANSVQTNPFGITFDLADFSGTSSSVVAAANDPIIHGTAGNVTKVQWANGTSMTLTPTANSSVKAVVYRTGTNSGNNNVLVAYATFGSGKVVAIGDSSPTDDGTGNPNASTNNCTLYNGYTSDASGNHQRLLMNATIWLTTPVLANPEFNLQNAAISLGQNPIDAQQIQLNNASMVAIDRFQLFGLDGKLIDSRTIDSSDLEINISLAQALHSGMYLLKLFQGNEAVTLKCVVK